MLSELLSTMDQNHFDDCHSELVADLCSHWEREMGAPLGCGASRKLVDLLLKRACLWDELPERRAAALISLLHAPLDHFVIQSVKNCIDDEAKAAGLVKRIPSVTGMRFVETPAIYCAFQGLLRRISARAGVPPIAIDILAWDNTHEIACTVEVGASRSLGDGQRIRQDVD